MRTNSVLLAEIVPDLPKACSHANKNWPDFQARRPRFVASLFACEQNLKRLRIESRQGHACSHANKIRKRLRIEPWQEPSCSHANKPEASSDRTSARAHLFACEQNRKRLWIEPPPGLSCSHANKIRKRPRMEPRQGHACSHANTTSSVFGWNLSRGSLVRMRTKPEASSDGGSARARLFAREQKPEASSDRTPAGLTCSHANKS